MMSEPRKNFWGNLMDKVQAAMNAKEHVKAHSNNGVAVPQPPTLNLNNGRSQQLTYARGAHLKIPELTIEQLEAREAKFQKQWDDNQKLYGSGISHTGALNYTSSGATTSINRVDAAKDLHKRIEMENRARDTKASVKEKVHEYGKGGMTLS